MVPFPSCIVGPPAAVSGRAWHCLAVFICALVTPVALLCQQPLPPDDVSAQVKALNAQLVLSVSAATEPAGLGEVLKTRAALLSQLMVSDPAKAAELALPEDIAKRLRASAPKDTVEVVGEWTGTLRMVVEDDFEHHRSRTRWILPTAERIYDVIAPELPKWRSGTSVKVTGVALGGRIIIKALDDTSPGSGIFAQGCTTTGVQNIAVILVTMPRAPTLAPGYTVDAVRQAFFGDPTQAPGNMTLNGWWNEMSHGQISATGEVLGPFALSQDYTCDQALGDLEQAAMAAANSSVDITKFNHIVVVFPKDQSCSFSGVSDIGCGSLTFGSKTFPATSEALPFGADDQSFHLGVAVHELGHGLGFGLGHASSDDYGSIPLGALNLSGALTEYGDWSSVMGKSAGANAGQFDAEHSLLLHWLHPGDFLEVSAPGTYLLAPYETNGLRALRVLRDAGSDAWLWVEYRQPIGDVDSALSDAFPAANMFEGALIHYADPNLSDPQWTYLLDFNPTGTPNDFQTAALTPGKTWSDPYSPLSLKVNSATPQGLSVTVGYDPPCTALQFSSTSFPQAGGAGTVTVTAPATCSWTASAAPGWITLSGATSGAGNGSISFTVAANGAGDQRRGSITVGRQSATISQVVGTLTVGPMDLQNGPGASGLLTFHFSDSAGATDISSITVVLGSYRPCHLTATPRGAVSLGGSSLQLPASGASASDGTCTVFSNGSSITSSGNELAVTLSMAVAAPMEGIVRISAEAIGFSGADTGSVQVGTWVVPGGDCTFSVVPASQDFGPAGGSGQIAVATSTGCSWTAFSTASWLTVTSSSPAGSGTGTVTYSVAANSTGSPRTAFVMVGGQAFPVRQGGPFVISTLAGGEIPATQGSAEDSSAPLSFGIVSDATGNLYFASQKLHTIFKVSTGGIITRVAGTGVPDFAGDGGPAVAARLNQPQGLAIDASGNLFIADTNNQRVRKIGTDGAISTVAGTGGCCDSGDNGPATSAQLGCPASVAVDASGTLFILDGCGLRVRKVDPSGTITTIAGNGTAGYSGDGGPATSAQLNNDAHGLALDPSGILYIADSGNFTIRKVASGGTITTVAGNGTYGYSGDGGPATRAQLNRPYGLSIDATGNLYIADTNSSLVRKVNTAGMITTVAGNGNNGYDGDGGAATSAAMARPYGVTVDKAGILYIADQGNQRIRRVSGGIISTIAGATFGDGTLAVFGSLNAPNAVAKDKIGNVYVTDSGHNSVRRIAADGAITTLAGTGVSGYSGDGGPAVKAELNQPSGIAVDSSGAVFIADSNNHRIRKVATDGTITTIAGTGCCYSGDGGPATSAQLNSPHGLFMDASSNLFIADSGNNRIRKVDPKGTITTFAGNGNPGLAGDSGPATAAELLYPTAIGVDSAGGVFIADGGNNLIRKIDTKGLIKTVAGSTPGYSGDGGPAASAQLNRPAGVAIDSAGNLYIADTDNSRIRMVNPAGVINLVAGNGDMGRSGDGGPPTHATVGNPAGLFLDPSGNLYIADQSYNNVRVLIASGVKPVLAVQSVHDSEFVAGQPGSYTVTVSNALNAGPTSGAVTFTASVPPGLAIGSLSGSGWNCSTNQCTRSDVLAGGNSYPPVTVTVMIEAAAGTQATPQFTVSGGGGIAAGVGDFTVIGPAPSGTTTPTPSIATVVNAASMLPGIADGSWVLIRGTNLSSMVQSTQNGGLGATNYPTILDGVSAAIGGFLAPLSYISPTQLIVQAPQTGLTGPVDVVVTNNSRSSAGAHATIVRDAPGVFVYGPGGNKYPVAIIQNGNGTSDYLGPAGLPGLTSPTRPARPGELVGLYATGLGPTNPSVQVGTVFAGSAPLVDPVTVTIGGVTAHASFAGLVGTGLYELKVTVPNLAAGDQPLLVSVNGATSQPGVFVTVGK